MHAFVPTLNRLAEGRCQFRRGNPCVLRVKVTRVHRRVINHTGGETPQHVIARPSERKSHYGAGFYEVGRAKRNKLPFNSRVTPEVFSE